MLCVPHSWGGHMLFVRHSRHMNVHCDQFFNTAKVRADITSHYCPKAASTADGQVPLIGHTGTSSHASNDSGARTNMPVIEWKYINKK